MRYKRNIDIGHYFKYHPPKTEERKNQHEKVNKCSENLAREIVSVLDPEDPNVDKFLEQIQIMRMLMNQQITVNELEFLESLTKENS